MLNHKFKCFCEASAFYIYIYDDKIKLVCPFCYTDFGIRSIEDFKNWDVAKEFTKDLKCYQIKKDFYEMNMSEMHMNENSMQRGGTDD